MFSNSVRLILSLVSLLFAMYHFSKGEIYLGGLFVIALIFLIYGYFLYGSVWSAFQNIQKGKNEKAENLINSIIYPNLLTKQQKGFYFFTKAILEQEKKNLDKAESFYLQALEQDVRTTKNEAIINLNLAKIYLEKNLINSAKIRLENATNLSNKKEIDIEIEKLLPELEKI